MSMGSELGDKLTERKRRPIMRRVAPEDLPPFRITKRDIAILGAVYRYRALSTQQIQTLLFPTGPNDKANSRCQYRLQLLYHAGYLGRMELPSRLSEGRRPLVYYLELKGVQLLAKLGDLE